LSQYKTIKSVAIHHPKEYVKYHQGFKALLTERLQPRTLEDPVFTIWMRGPTGIGKSRSIVKFLKNNNIPESMIYTWSYKTTGVWFEGYIGQRIIILDEFKGGEINMMLRLCQSLPFSVQVHGNQMTCCATLIFVTCNDPHQVLFAHASQEQIEALERRISEPIGWALGEAEIEQARALPFEHRDEFLEICIGDAIAGKEAWTRIQAEAVFQQDEEEEEAP